jgi:primosomal protein N' (replication factor Y) (superfamily II helicase)
MSMSARILEVAVANTSFAWLDYLPPEGVGQVDPSCIGRRVKVKVRQRELIGVVVGVKSETNIAKIKPIVDWVDAQPLLAPSILQLCRWLSDYYHYPLSDVIDVALPKKLRQGLPASLDKETMWQLHPAKRDEDPAVALGRAPRQLAIVQYLQQHSHLSANTLSIRGWKRSHIRQLLTKGWLLESEHELQPVKDLAQARTGDLSLSEEQQTVFNAIHQQLSHYACHLLYGVTGSGKTEVYLQLTRAVLQAGRQVLILVPEIGLTPQIIARFRERFSEPQVTLHSGLNDSQRLQAWLLASRGIARIVIGTRSALFTPLPELGLIIIDEEHDMSFKQQDRLRYSARDGAIVYAQQRDIPIMLGSATPSLESMANVARDRYQLHRLTERAGDAKPVDYQIIDMRRQPLINGLSHSLLSKMRQHLADGRQVLLFINRRGYAPVLMCHSCGWIADCRACDAHMTVHLNPDYLQCHHCGARQGLITKCPQCDTAELISVGIGTKRLEQSLIELFPDYPVVRIDRDSTRHKQAMQTIMERVTQGDPQILLGTQMLAKGHHFPDVTLVGIVDADSGLFSPDFRAQERLVQLLLQVAGRAGRAQHAGEVLIQTHSPEHPLLTDLITQPYDVLVEKLLAERRQACLPPYSAFALLRCEAKSMPQAMTHLTQIRQQLSSQTKSTISLLGPIPAPMQKRAGFFHAQLLLSCPKRRQLQDLLAAIAQRSSKIISQTPLKCTLDVDPLELF